MQSLYLDGNNFKKKKTLNKFKHYIELEVNIKQVGEEIQFNWQRRRQKAAKKIQKDLWLHGIYKNNYRPSFQAHLQR